jgi:adenylate cyclase
MTAPRILVVDDEPDVEALISQKFRRKVRNGEIDFLFAGDGEQALEILRQNPDVEVVLSDINMPRMDGLTLLERLGELERDLKTVIVSAYGDMRNIRSAMNRGAFDFITKPIEFEDLETTLAKTLEQCQLIRELRESRDEAVRARTMLSRYFSPNVVEALARDPEYLDASGEWRDATFLFTDLANFTPLVESSASDVIVRILKNYLDGVTETIFTHSGTVMKIIGDAVQAIFGAPMEDTDHAAHAVGCALAIDAFAEGFRARLQEEGIDLGITRIGVNTGHAIIGNFGSKRFFDYTAYGDAVNIAARLEQANKVIGTHICVSESVIEKMTDFWGRPIGTLLLKGKTQAVRCFEPLHAERATEGANRAYLDAFALLEAGDPKARQAFATLMGQNDDDALVTYHLGRLLSGESGAEIEFERRMIV